MKAKEIWWINFDPSQGAEISKKRPALIVNDNSMGVLPLRVIVPLTEWKAKYESADWHCKITADSKNNLTKDSTADCFQIKSLSTTRFCAKLGELDDVTFEKIKQAIKNVLSLS